MRLEGDLSGTFQTNKIRKIIAAEIPAKVTADAANHNNMKNNDKEAMIEHDTSLQCAKQPHRVVQAV